MISNFVDLLAPLDGEVFFREYFGKKPVHIQGNPDRLKDIMDWHQLNEMIRQAENWRPDNFKLIKNHNPAPPQVYCRPIPPGDMGQVMRPAWDLVENQIRDGATIALYFVQSMTEALRDATLILEDAVGGRVQMNIYCSWVQGKALAPHFDTHDVFAFHVEGKKQWTIYEDPIINPVAHEMFDGAARRELDSKPRKVLMKPILEPGDVLYLPRGWYHEAQILTPGCFHVAAGVHYPNGLDILNAAWQLLSAEPLFRSAIENADSDGGEAALAQQLQNMSQTITKIMESQEFVEQVGYVRDTFRAEKIPANLPDDVFSVINSGK